MEAFSQGRAFEAFNARFLSASEVASTFVPPPQYDKLLEQNHTVLLGPRGSGKTTLLKMLQLRSLAAWSHDKAATVRASLPFHAIFLGTDVLWGSQLESRTSTIADAEKAAQIRRTSFRLHLALAFLNAVEECRDPLVAQCDELKRFTVQIDRDREAALADALADVWRILPATRTLLGVRSAIQRHLSELLALVNELRVQPDASLPSFVFVDPIASITQAIDLTNQLFGQPERRWAILCDELEIAPEIVRTELFAMLRSTAQPVVFKFSFFPYSSDLQASALSGPNAPSAGNDFTPLDLTYGLRENAYQFCTALLRGMVLNAGGPQLEKPEEMLGDGWFDGGRRNRRENASAYGPNGEYYKRAQLLMKGDRSFRYWLSRMNIDIRHIQDMQENEQATFRKALPFILTRSEFRRPDGGLRSRKSMSLYTGAYSMFSLTEGNPRIFINLMRPLVAEFVTREGTIGADLQARSAELTLHRFRSSLSAIPAKRAGRITSIIHLVHVIGQYFEVAQLQDDFSPEPPGTFIVDDDVDGDTRELVGRALNAGSLVRIEGKGGPIVGQIAGARLRIAYTLAPEYKLPLAAGRPINLSTILSAHSAGRNRDPLFQSQPRLAFGIEP